MVIEWYYTIMIIPQNPISPSISLFYYSGLAGSNDLEELKAAMIAQTCEDVFYTKVFQIFLMPDKEKKVRNYSVGQKSRTFNAMNFL